MTWDKVGWGAGPEEVRTGRWVGGLGRAGWGGREPRHPCVLEVPGQVSSSPEHLSKPVWFLFSPCPGQSRHTSTSMCPLSSHGLVNTAGQDRPCHYSSGQRAAEHGDT